MSRTGWEPKRRRRWLWTIVQRT